MEREMNRLVTVTVSLYGDQSSKIKVQASVQTDNTVSVDSIFTRVCKTIGLQETSWQFFTLVEGATKPVRKLRLNDSINLPCPELCLRKWTFEAGQEKALFKDPVAMEMLFKHAAYDIRTGGVCPDEVTRKKLEECIEPSFHIDTQYVSVCHGIPDYNAMCFPHCITQGPCTLLELPKKSVIDLNISTRGLHCITANHQSGHSIPWTAIKSWSHSSDHTTFTFDLVLLGLESSLRFSTTQTQYMLSVILEIVRILQKQQKRGDTTMYFASDIHRAGDHVMWDNLLYDPGTENPVFVHSPTQPTQRGIFT